MMEVSGSRLRRRRGMGRKSSGRVRGRAGRGRPRALRGAGSARRRPPNRTRWSSRVSVVDALVGLRADARWKLARSMYPQLVMYASDCHIVARPARPDGLTSRDQDIKIDCRINFYASPHERLGNRLPEIYCQNFPLVTLTEHTPRITISQIKEPVSISSSTINYMKLG